MTDSSPPRNSASRKHPTTRLARGIDELDALESLAIPKRSSWPGRAPEGERQFSASVPTLAAIADHADAGVSEINERPSRPQSKAKLRSSHHHTSARSPRAHAAWPQWAFATVVLGAALWYLFNVQSTRSASSPIEVERRALTPAQ